MSGPRGRAETARCLMDVVGAAVGLALTAPVQAAVAVAVWACDGPPVLYRGSRVGMHGRPFLILKFRTMTVDGDRAGSITIADDARITRTGKFLRKWKLDELPQLWNVLRGEMSLVGPRPEVPEYVRRYDEEIRRTLLAVRPGLTDPASIAFRNEAALIHERADAEGYYLMHLMPLKNQLSANYLQSRTLKSDLRVMANTVLAIARPNATGADDSWRIDVGDPRA